MSPALCLAHALRASTGAVPRSRGPAWDASRPVTLPRVLTPLEVTAGVGLLAAALAFTAALLQLRQRTASDRLVLQQKADSDAHTAWWVRAQWAIDKSLSLDRRTREIGTDAMQVLGADPTPTVADLNVLDAAIVRALDPPVD